MIRIIVQDVSCNPEGSKVGVRFFTFDIDADKLQRHLSNSNTYVDSTVIGAEILKDIVND